MTTTIAHIGITVTDIERTCEFYAKYFGFERDYALLFDEDFVRESAALYREPDGVFSDMRMLLSPDGVRLELFRFSNVEPGGPVVWHKTGLTHIALRVKGLPELYERMKADGVEFFEPMKVRLSDGGHWIFLKDPEGNLVELLD